MCGLARRLHAASYLLQHVICLPEDIIGCPQNTMAMTSLCLLVVLKTTLVGDNTLTYTNASQRHIGDFPYLHSVKKSILSPCKDTMVVTSDVTRYVRKDAISHSAV